MFFGKIITPQSPFLYTEETVDEKVGDVISISNVALGPSSKQNVTLYIKKSGQQHLIAHLTKKKPHVYLHLYISIHEQAQLFVKGNGIVHVIGFFQPEPKIQHLDQVQLYNRMKIEPDEKIFNELTHEKQQVKNVNEKGNPSVTGNFQKFKYVEKKMWQSQQQGKGNHQQQQQYQNYDPSQQQQQQQERQQQRQQKKEESQQVGLSQIDDDIDIQNQPTKIQAITNKTQQKSNTPINQPIKKHPNQPHPKNQFHQHKQTKTPHPQQNFQQKKKINQYQHQKTIQEKPITKNQQNINKKQHFINKKQNTEQLINKKQQNNTINFNNTQLQQFQHNNNQPKYPIQQNNPSNETNPNAFKKKKKKKRNKNHNPNPNPNQNKNKNNQNQKHPINHQIQS